MFRVRTLVMITGIAAALSCASPAPGVELIGRLK